MQEVQTDRIVAALHPLVKAFFERMSPSQLEMMQQGNPDLSVTSLLAEMLLDIITKLSRFLAALLKDGKISEAQVSSVVEATVPQTFAEVLKAEETVTSHSSNHLVELISKEVIEEVKSEAENVVSRGPPPKRLNKMVGHASKMIKSLRSVRKGRRKGRESAASCPVIRTPPPGDGAGADSVPPTARTHEDREASQLDQDVLTVSPDHLQHVMMTAVAEIAEPLSEDMTKSDYESVQAGLDEKTELMVEEIYESMEPVATSPRSPELRMDRRNKVGSKIKTFFAKLFATVAIHRAVAELRAKHRVSSKRGQSAQEVAARIEELLELKEEGEGQEVSEYKRLKNNATGKNVQFAVGLGELFMDSLGPGVTGMRGTFTRGRASVSPPPFHDVHADVQHKVKRVTSMMDWWFKIKSDSHRDKLMHALKLVETKPPPLALAGSEFQDTELKEPSVESPELAELPAELPEELPAELLAQLPEEQSEEPDTHKFCVVVMVHTLVSGVFKKAGLSQQHTRNRQNIVTGWLLEEVWKEVENLDIGVTLSSAKHHMKDMVNELSYKCGGLDALLGALVAQKTFIIQHVVTCFREPRRRKNAVSRFFMTLGGGN